MKCKIGADFLREKLKTVSKRPGVYRMLDENGSVLYVGKAKNLKHRLTNYTQENRLSYRIRQMVSKVHDLITVETAGEAEAFLLEAELIKQFRPYYNILLKDDKSYPYILLTKEKYPRLCKYRGDRKKDGTYFGPFDSGLSVNNTIKSLQKIFGIRSCANSYFAGRKRPCLLYQIKRCVGPCCGCVSDVEYEKLANQVRDFMAGKSTLLQNELTKQMQSLSKAQEFEKAAAVRDKIWALNHIQGTGTLQSADPTDVVAVATEGSESCIQIFFHRPNLSGNIYQMVKDFNVEDLPSLLLQVYDKLTPPSVLCLSEKIAEKESFEKALSALAGKKVQIALPPFRLARRQWMSEGLQNAMQTLQQNLNKTAANTENWNTLQQLVDVPVLNKVEVYDNSHIQGTAAVGAMIVATRDGFQKKLYRRFNIECANTNDDFGMMREVLTRRLKRGLKENDLPDLIILDGGKGQMSQVLDVFKKMKVKGVRVLAMAKGAGQHDKGLETLFLDAAPTTPIVLDHKSQVMFLLQRLRDEAHRFAIGSHRAKRSREMFHETLRDIEGIGPKRKKDLMAYFGSVRAISGASLAQLMRVPGFNEKIAKKVYTFFHD
ncbi:MAG: excinuclease ABC subunit UvrC [Alphaproteobacteria bacterium]|nr:excinuclease ABC subunit UvrC [Alphaproteobacteria bacterium]